MKKRRLKCVLSVIIDDTDLHGIFVAFHEYCSFRFESIGLKSFAKTLNFAASIFNGQWQPAKHLADCRCHF
jgi:hypothetical protein